MFRWKWIFSVGCGVVMFASIILFFSCASNKLEPLRRSDISGISTTEFKGLQVYLWGDIILRRELTSGDSAVSKSHKLINRYGKTIEEIIFPAKTPGIFMGWACNGCMTVSFEPPSEVGELYLTFCQLPGMLKSRGINYTGAYCFACDCDEAKSRWTVEWIENFGEKKSGKVWYGGKQFGYYTAYGCLAVDREAINKIRRERRIVPGRRLDNQEQQRF